MTFPGRLLGIDHGLQVLGFATCDAIGLIAAPHSIRHRTSKQEDFAHINRLLEQERIAAIILGLPPRPPDFEGYSQSDTVRLWGQRLVASVQVPIYLWDEGLSSVDAEEYLHTIGKRTPERIDAYAAAVILQTFLDAIREGMPWPDRLSAE